MTDTTGWLFPSSKMAKFRVFHEANPQVFELFKQFAHEARDAGMPSYSARAIFARIRWHCDIETASDDGFKLNDHLSPYYARLLMDSDPRFDGFFELRRLRA